MDKEKKEKKSFCFFLCSSSSKKRKQDKDKDEPKKPVIDLSINEKKENIKSNSMSKLEGKKDDTSIKTHLHNNSHDRKNDKKNENKQEPINVMRQYNTSKNHEVSSEKRRNNEELRNNSYKRADISVTSKAFETPINEKSKQNNSYVVNNINKTILNSSITVKDINKEKDFSIVKKNESERNSSYRTNNRLINKRSYKELNIDLILIEENNKYNSNTNSNQIAFNNLNQPGTNKNINNESQIKSNKEIVPLSSNKSISSNRRVSNPVDQNEKINESLDEAEIEDEYKVDINDSVNDSILNKSIISSNILSHINTPKLFSTIKNINDMSYCSSYAKSEFSRTDTFKENDFIQTNPFNTIGKPFYQTQKSSTDFTEFEMINEDRFNRYLETPKSSTLVKINNPNMKNLYEKLYKKEKTIKHLNEKITKMLNEINMYEEENKKLCNKIEKEEAEGERLRHLLNFLITG